MGKRLHSGSKQTEPRGCFAWRLPCPARKCANLLQ